jgi:hypothetical protein
MSGACLNSANEWGQKVSGGEPEICKKNCKRTWLALEKKASPMVGFPLLLIPLAIYNIIVFLMPGVSLADPLFKLTLMSGAEWSVTLSDILLALGVIVLLLEVIKGARPGAKYLTDHLLSLIVCGAAVAEFLLWPRFGSSTYFLLCLLALADFLSGLALRRGRRQPQFVEASAVTPAVSRRAARKADVVPAEPQFDPAPLSPAAPAAVPAAASVAESVLSDHSQPKVVVSEVAPAAPSAEVVSLTPSPEDNAPRPPDAPAH